MWSRPDSTIAQILYTGGPPPNFAALVSMIDRHLSRHFPAGHSLSWDYDDIATFDAGGLRLLLAKSDPAPRGYSACLMLAAGPCPELEDDTIALLTQESLTRVLSQLVEGTLRQHPAETVLWQRRKEPLDTELADALVSTLPARAEVEHLADSLNEIPVTQPGPSVVARATGLRVEDGPDRIAMARVRDALYGEVTPAPGAARPLSPQMRLAIHAMNCTLIAVALPVGAAMMAHSFRKGESLVASARALALTGIGLALWDQMAAMSLPA